MATWINHVTVAAPRNGTTSHTVGADGTGGTVVGGTAFTPTAGRYLLAVCEGAITFTTPAGWSLGTSAVSNSGLYAFYRASATGTTADRLTSTHNASNYPIVVDFYEFAAGTTWKNGTGSSGIATTGGGTPSLGGLTGTYWAGYAQAADMTAVATSAGSVSWTAPAVERTETSTLPAATDGYEFSMADREDVTGASTSATFAISGASGTASGEAITVAQVVVAAGGVTVTGAAAFTAGSTLTATASTKGNVAGAAALAGQSTQTAAGKAEARAAAALAGSGTVTATASTEARAAAALSASGTATAAGTTSTPNAPQVFGSAALTATSSQSAAGSVTVTGAAGLSGQTTLAGVGRVDVAATAALQAAGLLAAGAHLQATAAAALSATGTLTARAVSGVAVNIDVTVGPPARAWAAGTPDRGWKAGPPTL